MSAWALILILLGFSSLFYFWAKQRSLRIAKNLGGIRYLHSAPKYYGIVAAMLFAIPAMAVLGLWLSVDENIILRIVMSEFFPDMRARVAGRY